jgi:adenine-specific DNA-methyltransferase
MQTAQQALLQFTGGQTHFWNDFAGSFPTEKQLIAVAMLLGADLVGPWSVAEKALAQSAADILPISNKQLATIRNLIREGYDPLGEVFCTLRPPVERREHGATYTPSPIVRAMTEWAASYDRPQRIVDPGSGSGRFLLAAGEKFPKAQLIGVDIDPLAALLARANMATVGMADRARIIVGDYRRFNESEQGKTLYIGNPPYVRHHQITPKWKDWLFGQAEKLGLPASKLAGLHVHFFLATACAAKEGDFGVFITASEWLDVNYGSLVRALILNQLGGQSVTVIEPTAQPFPDAATTAAISTFEIGSQPTSLYFRRVDSLRTLDSLDKGRRVHRDRLVAESRWSHLTRAGVKPPEGYVELGELCRVHRGQVTGANNIWIAGPHSEGLPSSVLFRTITRAREVFESRGILEDASKLKCVIDIPIDLEMLDAAERRRVESFLTVARKMGGNKGYIASHRRAWWSVGLRTPAAIIATYMARRPPAFLLNRADARHINIAHGLYPRATMSETMKKTLVSYMQTNISQLSGRTYAGGLTKFEPREMERLVVPNPAMLAAGVQVA